MANTLPWTSVQPTPTTLPSTPAQRRRIALIVTNESRDIWVWRGSHGAQYTALDVADVAPNTDPAVTARRCAAATFGILGCGPRLRLVAWRPPAPEAANAWTHAFAYTCVSGHEPDPESAAGAGSWADDERLAVLEEYFDPGVSETLRCYALVSEHRRDLARRR
ncbi:hypothetical protein ACFC1T_09465 [Kitasatospora sp. NPDC056076]|uniref:hypothetical protein n=1 Tax=Kitasatospora sp. NPDC056076 TaxID=3345703 RepID=UPI0035E147B7